MMKVKFPTGTTQENNQLLLPEGMLSIDTEKKALRLHDGITQGGFELVGEQAFYDPWTTPFTLTQTRARHTGAVIDNYLYDIAGLINSSQYPYFARYDLDTGEHTVLAGAPRVVYPSSVVIDNRIYVFGGENTSGSEQTPMNVYDPDTNTWTVVGAYATYSTRQQQCAAAVVDNNIFIHGGYRSIATLSTTTVYDTLTNTTTQVSDGPVRRRRHTMTAINGKLYVFGGTTAATVANSIDTLSQYDPQTDMWVNLSSGPSARMDHSAVEIQGKLYIFGGTGIDGSLNDLWVYDPIMDVWEESVPFTSWRTGHIAVAYNDNMYVHGGTGGDSEHLKIQRFNPSAVKN